jgi:hypothetical protein
MLFADLSVIAAFSSLVLLGYMLLMAMVCLTQRISDKLLVKRFKFIEAQIVSIPMVYNVIDELYSEGLADWSLKEFTSLG